MSFSIYLLINHSATIYQSRLERNALFECIRVRCKRAAHNCHALYELDVEFINNAFLETDPDLLLGTLMHEFASACGGLIIRGAAKSKNLT